MKFYASGSPFEMPISQVIVAGWTGRNQSAVTHHIEELKAVGISPPSKVPLFYRVSNFVLSQDDIIEVLGEATSGEVEPLLVKIDGRLWLGLASDHTDRELEVISVAASKQACPKPVSPELWSFDEVVDHIDDLILRNYIEEDGDWVLYQQGTLAEISELAALQKLSGLRDGGVMLCGTLPAIGPIRPAVSYRMEMEDREWGRTLHLDYKVRTLPIVV